MRRKLSHIEHIVEGNIVLFIRLEGRFEPARLRSALARVQRKHPALRALLRQGPDGLYYEEDSAPEIPLRIAPRATEEDYRRECHAELNTDFAADQPLMRAVWLRSDVESDLLVTTSHRICDGMSLLTIVREALHALHSDDALIPYEPVTRRDIAGDYRPPHPWKRNLAAFLINGLLRLIPESRRTTQNKERYLEWSGGCELLAALKRRCKEERAGLHAALLVALDRALVPTFGNAKLPKWIENPVDIRQRGFPALKSDMLFFSGGNFKVPTGSAPATEFWTRARAIHEQIHREVERETSEIPGAYHFSEMLRPLTRRQVQSVVRLGDAFRMNGSWNRFALSNLGRVTITAADAPFRVKDLRVYMHSFTFRALCLITYTFNGEMRFCCVSDERCMDANQIETLRREFMAVLNDSVPVIGAARAEAPRIPAQLLEVRS
jgi:hypothetical protein